MFGRKKPEAPRSETAVTDNAAPPLKLRSSAPPAAPTNLVAPVQPRYEIPRRATDSAPRPAAAAVSQPRPEPAAAVSEGKKLLVGRDIVLSGEITTCDQLVVEGRVEAALTDSRVIEIRETGVFKGMAEIDDAEIRGVFEGELAVRNRLLIPAPGRVVGKIRYGMLEVECGGQLSGDIQIIAMAEPEGQDSDEIPESAGSDDDLGDILDGETAAEESWQIPARQ